MKTIQQSGWVYYVGDTSHFCQDKVGKWMYFFSDKSFIAKVCETAVKENIVNESKHSDDETGVACFYLNCDDMDAHKRII